MTAAEIADVLAQTALVDVTTALQAAYTAAQTDKRWRAYPIKCPLSGLALQVQTR